MSETEKTLEFSLKLKSIPVVLEDTTGNKGDFTLIEMDGEGVDKWHGFVQEKLNLAPESNEDGSIKVKVKSDTNLDLTGMESKLLSMCLFDSKNVLVPEGVIQKFPAHVRTALFDAAQKINGLDVESKKKAKND